MKESDFIDLVLKKYPELFNEEQLLEKMSTNIFLPVGWQPIVLGLFDNFVSERVNADNNIYTYLEIVKQIEKNLDENSENYNSDLEKIESWKNKISEIELSKKDFKYPKIIQVKEKFGELRIYLSDATEKNEIAIKVARNISRNTCQFCSEIGKAKSNGHWVYVACDKHHEEMLKKKNN